MKEIIDLMGLDIEKVRDLLLGESIQCEILSGLLFVEEKQFKNTKGLIRLLKDINESK